MAYEYLDWLAEVFEDAQVPYTPDTAPQLDRALRNIVSGPDATDEEVYRRLRHRWLNHGLPGRQLLASFLRDEVYSRRDSELRPREGGGYYTNAYVPTAVLPHPTRRTS